jgi:peptidoglycan/xylan/chitin deacetylase (PgdA/CDA1 family)
MMSTKRYAPTAPILLYHRFDPKGPTTLWTVGTDVFEAQLQWLKQNSYRVLPLRSVIDEMRGVGPPVGPRAVVITADDGDRSVYTDMFPLLKKFGVPATLFVTPFAISRSDGCVTWEQLKEMSASGLVDVQFHTLSHPDFEFERKRRGRGGFQVLAEFELDHSRDWIEQRLNQTVDMLAWPYGYYDQDLEQLASQSGFVAALSIIRRSAEDDSIFAVPRVVVANRHRAGERFRALVEQPHPNGQNL